MATSSSSSALASVPPTYQLKAKWGATIPEGSRAMNTTSSVVPRWFRGHNETIRIAGPGEKPSVPVSQRSETEQSALIAAKALTSSTTKTIGASGTLTLLSQSQSQPQSQLQTLSQSQLQTLPQSQLQALPQPSDEDEWERDMRLIRENEYWEGRIVDIPTTHLQDRYRAKFTDIGVHQKIGVFKMLEYFEWTYERSLQVLLPSAFADPRELPTARL
jgi:hypothetical protein